MGEQPQEKISPATRRVVTLSPPSLGKVIEWARKEIGMTQSDLAELMTAQGVHWRREQVLRVEAGQREISAHEILVAAHVLRMPLWAVYQMAGYPDQHVMTASWQSPAFSDVPDVKWDPSAIAAASGFARAYMLGLTRGRDSVNLMIDAWREYETRSGRRPGERAERAKRAALWRAYEDDPDAFDARARAQVTGSGADRPEGWQA